MTMKSPRPVRPRSRTRRVSLVAFLALLLGLGPGSAAEPSPPAAATRTTKPTLRLGYSRQVFLEINENDGRAALKMHAEAIAKTDGIELVLIHEIFEGTAAIRRALERKEADALGLPVDEFIALPPELVAGPLIAPKLRDSTGDKYLLVVRRDRGIENAAGLKGKRVAVQRGFKAPLTVQWLDILTLREHLGPASQALREMISVTKPSRAVLPVFFGQIDACVVPDRSLRVLEELNPQIARDLKVLATSDAIVPSMMCFRAGLDPAMVDDIAARSSRMHLTVSGAQVALIFQLDQLVALPSSSVDAARALLAEHTRLLAADRSASPPAILKTPPPARD